jgi:hypothetical protein
MAMFPTLTNGEERQAAMWLCNIIPSITQMHSTHLFSDFLQHSTGNNSIFTTELPVVVFERLTIIVIVHSVSRQ